MEPRTEQGMIPPMLCPTPEAQRIDAQGRPYFLWDVDMTLARFLTKLDHLDPDVRGYWAGKLLRQAKPDDALLYITPQEIADLWPHLERYLGLQRGFWTWLLDAWGQRGRVRR